MTGDSCLMPGPSRNASSRLRKATCEAQRRCRACSYFGPDLGAGQAWKPLHPLTLAMNDRTTRTFSPPSRRGRADAYLQVLHALMLRDMRTRFGGSYLGYGVVVLWPVVHTFILVA